MIQLTPAQRVALAGMADPAVLCRNDWLDHFSREPGVCWFVYVPQEWRKPEFWSLTPEEGEALVEDGLVEGVEIIELSPESTVTTYRITDAGRALVKQKRLRRKITREDNATREALPEQPRGPIPGGAERSGADPEAAPGEGSLFDPV